MAKSSAAAGETKTPLIVALVFFVLATIGLGVYAYTLNDDVATAKGEAETARKDKETSDTAATKAREETMVYKAALGILNEAEQASFRGIRYKPDAQAAFMSMREALAAKAAQAITEQRKNFTGGGAPFSAVPDDLLAWNWASGAEPTLPSRSIVDGAVAAMAQRELNERFLAVEKKRLQEDTATFNRKTGELDSAANEFKAKTRDIPGTIAKGIEDAQRQYDQKAEQFKTEQAAARESVQQATDQFVESELQTKKLAGTVKQLDRRIEELLSKETNLIDPFAFDKPQGRILRRYSDSLVDIDLGTSDKLRPGISFSIFPSDTVVRGMQPRNRAFRTQEGTVAYRPVPKGKIEVINVLGPNIAQCRIVSEDDAVRDRVIPGDLLYNALWRRGTSEHVVLFGVFDLDGDGRDDTQSLIAGLRRVGVVVDAYYDLSKNDPDPENNWVGEVTSQTNFAIEGYYPTVSAADGNREAKIAVLNAISKARGSVREKGINILRPRDFFPRIGFNARLDISQDAINQASMSFARSLMDPVPGNPPGNPDQN